VFNAWDGLDRPVAGLNTGRATTTPFSIVYDDARRTATWSNGDFVAQDANGNVIEERSPIGHQVYTITFTAELCK
jgi:hypothetical protein